MSTILMLVSLTYLVTAAESTYAGYKPVRTRAEVEARGREVIARYSNKTLAAYGILDATQAPYLADPTGGKDATESIRQAMADARDAQLVTFLPAGTYTVSGTIECVQGTVRRNEWQYGPADPVVENESYYFPCVLRGAGAGKTRLVLAPRSAGFGDPGAFKPLVHFWARDEMARTGTADFTKPHPGISFNQLIADLELVLGDGNPGAIGIDHQSAQGSAIQDVSIDATGAFAGVRRIPGSGGGIHGLTVKGGRYGIYARGESTRMGSQPVPVASTVTLTDQSEAAVLFDGRGPLTLVGGVIEGAGVRSEGSKAAPWNGALTLVDMVLRPRPGLCAIVSNHSVYLSNVYLENAETLACVDGHAPAKGAAKGWTHVEEYSVGGIYKLPGADGPFQPLVYLDGRATGSSLERIRTDAQAPPADLRERHAWPAMLPPWVDSGAANVRSAPYNAAGDGKTDDAAAIQRAIEEHRTVFLPKGNYRLSRPLVLKSDTRLIGVSNLLSKVSPFDAGAYSDAENPQPLIDTEDAPQATTVLAFVSLEVPVKNVCAYALRWRAGRRSVVRNAHPIATPWHPDAPAAFYPMVRIDGSGGGRWYDLTIWHWWNQGPDYRHLLVDGTQEPLSIYMLNPEHATSTAQVEFRSASNVSVYSTKSEGSYTTILMRHCRNVRLFGYGGISSPKPGWPVIRLEASRDILMANPTPSLLLVRKNPGNALSVPTDPHKWHFIEDNPEQGEAVVRLLGTGTPAMYRRGDPRSVW